MKILIFPCDRKLRNGQDNPRSYHRWNEVIKLLKEKNHEVEVCGVIPLPELKDKLKACDWVVTIDGFIQHFCWKLKVKCAVVWSLSDPLIFGHNENVNLLKDRKYLRKLQFKTWEGEKVNKDSFVTPEEIVEAIK